jgi:hypothetical protein
VCSLFPFTLSCHAGLVLNFALRVSRQYSGWQYRLFACQVSSPTNAGITH